MIFGTSQVYDKQLYKARRSELVRQIKEKHQESVSGLIVIFGGESAHCLKFSQDSSFYYLTGINEPGFVLTIDLNGFSKLYIPHSATALQKQWTGRSLGLGDGKQFAVDEVSLLSENKGVRGATTSVLLGCLDGFMADIAHAVKEKHAIFALCPPKTISFQWQSLLVHCLKVENRSLCDCLIDISPIVCSMRRRKDVAEIELMYKASEITMLAHESAAQAIAEGVSECEVQASLEYMMTGNCAASAFPSIVAGGNNSTILHYQNNNAVLKAGELVVVDIGAEYGHYCADVTRTYPVAGQFSKRQREIYEIVLQAQEYIVSLVRPGYWLSNEDEPDKSLNHLAKKFLTERGYGEYVCHGIGHFLGLDVHDVGDLKEPLMENDVITIEPGLYLPDENIGIRIEDDFWIVKDGCVCLTENLPKDVKSVEVATKAHF